MTQRFVDVLCGRRAANRFKGAKRRFRDFQDAPPATDFLLDDDPDPDDDLVKIRANEYIIFTESNSPCTPAAKSAVSLEIRSSTRSRGCRSRAPLSPLSPSCGIYQQEQDFALFFGDHFTHLCDGEEWLLRQPDNLDYLPVLPNDKAEMRKNMLDRMVRVHLEFCMKPQTLYLAVSLLDECLMIQRPVVPLQLLPPVALLAAAKFEELLPPNVIGCAVIEASGGQATQEEFEAAERALLAAVQYRMHRPTPAHHWQWFVEYLSQHEDFGDLKDKLTLVAAYLCELALLNEAAGRWAPSLHATATVMVAGSLLGRSSHALQSMAVPDERRLHQLRVILRSTCNLLADLDLEQHAIYQKYSGPDWSGIAPEVLQLMRRLE